ncbi:hypothetical protein [Arthrobacter sp. R4-81]
MMTEGSENQEVRSLRDQLRQAVDPSGEQFLMLDAIEASDLPGWFSNLNLEVSSQWSELASISTEYHQLLHSMEDALKVLVPRGWAPFHMDSKAISTAIELVRGGKGGQADELLADQWEGPGDWRLKQVVSRVRTMAAGEGRCDYDAMFRERARLLEKIKQHHEAGRYDASIPLIYNHIEGIVIDVSGGRKFFTSLPRSKADLIDPAQLVGIEACLPTLQEIFGGGVKETQALGSLSRHGIAHGRELAYDTRINSAKSWSLLHALVLWAQPLARRRAVELRHEREAVNADNQGIDENGRRIDNREFRETRHMLDKLMTRAMNSLASPGRTHRDIVGGVYTAKDFMKAGLHADHGMQTNVSRDGKIIWFWRTTISGWVLGAAVGITDRGFDVWYYSGPDAPLESPRDSPETWGPAHVSPPDWTS